MEGKDGKKRPRSQSKLSGSSQGSENAFKGIDNFMKEMSGRRVTITENVGDSIDQYEGIVRPHDSSVRRKQNLEDESPRQISIMRMRDNFECIFNVRDLVSPDAKSPHLPELREGVSLQDIHEISFEWVKDVSDDEMVKNLEVVRNMFKERPYAGGCPEGKKVIQDARPSLLNGKRIQVWWEAERNWFPGQVTEVNSKCRQMHVAYDDGDAADVAYVTDVWRMDKDVRQEKPVEESPPMLQTNSKSVSRGRSSASQKKVLHKDSSSSVITNDGSYQLWSDGKGALQLTVKSEVPLSARLCISDGGHGVEFATQDKSSEHAKDFLFVSCRKIKRASFDTMMHIKKDGSYRLDMVTRGP